MRLNHPLDGLLYSQTSTRVLRVVGLHPTRQLTSNEIAREAGAPTHRVLEALRRFEAEGIVTSRVVGPAYWWSVKDDHPLVRAAGDLFRAETVARAQLLDLVRKHLTATFGVQRVVLFGSAARREERSSSDLDLLAVVARAKDKQRLEPRIDALRKEARDRFGTRVRPLVYTRAQLARNRGRALFRNIEKEGLQLYPAEG